MDGLGGINSPEKLLHRVNNSAKLAPFRDDDVRLGIGGGKYRCCVSNLCILVRMRSKRNEPPSKFQTNLIPFRLKHFVSSSFAREVHARNNVEIIRFGNENWEHQIRLQRGIAWFINGEKKEWEETARSKPKRVENQTRAKRWADRKDAVNLSI